MLSRNPSVRVRTLLDHDSSQRHIMAKSISTYFASPILSSTASGTQPSAGTEETAQFMMVSSLLSESYDKCLQRGIYHAYMQRTHGRSMHRSSPNLKSLTRSAAQLKRRSPHAVKKLKEKLLGILTDAI